jgi:hypothetical protein
MRKWKTEAGGRLAGRDRDSWLGSAGRVIGSDGGPHRITCWFFFGSYVRRR